MGKGGKKEVYNAPAKREPIHRIECCSARNAALAYLKAITG
jgi:hypothetical protein